tara:strand:- start:781 stop:1221 length:441 start_codon:yes stop_codon:yes gene_type:complete
MNNNNQIPKTGKFLGIDYGAKRVGIAISDPLRIFASPYDTIIYNSQKQLIKKIEKIINTESIVFVVIGLPIGMNGKKTLQTNEVNEFIEKFNKESKLPLTTVDERLTSIQAMRLLTDQGIKHSKKKSLIDSTAASIILQTFLDSIK